MTKNKSHIIAQDVWDRDVFIMEECPFEEDVDRFLFELEKAIEWRKTNHISLLNMFGIEMYSSRKNVKPQN